MPVRFICEVIEPAAESQDIRAGAQGEPALPLRFRDVSAVHGRELLGADLQRSDLDLPGLRQAEQLLTGLLVNVRRKRPPRQRRAARRPACAPSRA